jgi:hypothetical protein
MALINQNELFDRLQEYIDQKIDTLWYKMRDLFEEYHVFEVSKFLEEINTVARLEDYIKIVESISGEIYRVAHIKNEIVDVASVVEEIKDLAPIADKIEFLGTITSELKLIADNIAEILKADDYALKSYWYSEAARARELTAKSYATQNYEENVIRYLYSTAQDSIIEIKTNDYSAYHWAEVARMYSHGLKFKGEWEVVNCSMPPIPVPESTESVDGTAYVVSKVSGDTLNCPDIYPGDWIVWTGDDASSPGVQGHWVVVHRELEWHLINNVPFNVLNALNSMGDIMTGDLVMGYSNKIYLTKDDGTNPDSYITINGESIEMRLLKDDGTSNGLFALTPYGLLYNAHKVWTSGNDGRGSGLDADKLGGTSYTEFVQSSDVDKMVVLTQDQYDSITPDRRTMYLIKCD